MNHIEASHAALCQRVSVEPLVEAVCARHPTETLNETCRYQYE